MDGFDRLPDPLILQIFMSVADVKTLIRLRSVSKRFNSLVPQTESLVLRVDRVVSPESDSEPFLLLLTLLRSLFKSLHDLFTPESPSSLPDPKAATYTRSNNYSPAQILSRFEQIRDLQIELPSGDLKLEKGVFVRWRAEFGNTLKSCVILGFRVGPADAELERDIAGGLKTRVVWTISALIAASTRHYLLREVVKEHPEVRRLVLDDKEGEGVVVMGEEGLKECRLDGSGDMNIGSGNGISRTVVPSVRMRMRHEPRVRVGNGWLEGATLVVVRPCCEAEEEGGGGAGDAELALGAFGSGAYGHGVRELLKSKSYLLEMNSF